MFLGIALVLLAIIFVATFASKWRVPLVVVSLFAGMIFGSDVLRVIIYHDYAGARSIADFALVFVLFIGGFGTRRDRLRKVLAPAMVMATAGVMMTAMITTVLLAYILKMPFQQAVLIGCVIASTDAAAVFSILRTRALDPKLSSLVEIESATNDPMAIILTTIAVQLTVAHSAQLDQPALLVFYLLWQIVGGVGVGLAIGYAAVYISRYVAELDKGYFYIFMIAVIMLSFGVADLAHASGILSAFFAGYIIGNANIPFKSTTNTLLDALSTIGNVAIFVLFGLLVSPNEFREIYLHGIVLFLILTFVARPVTVAVCMMFARFSIKQKIFLSWSGMRGAVPIVLATYPAAAGIEGAKNIFNIVFFAVLLSMIVQGSTITKLADKFKLAGKARPKPRQVMELVAMHNSELELVELDIDDEIYRGKAFVSDFKLPAGTTITMINRNDKIIAPTGRTEVKAGDVLYVLVNRNDLDRVNAEILRHFSASDPDFIDEEQVMIDCGIRG